MTAALALGALPAPFAAGAEPLTPRAPLAEWGAEVGVTPGELAGLGDKPFVKLMEVSQPSRELRIVGAVRIEVPRERYLAHFRDIGAYLDEPGLQQSGRFSAPAAPRDLARFELPESDLEVLASCRLAACKYKLPEGEIRWVSGFDWSSADAREKVSERFRTSLLNYVGAYGREGRPALVVYRDKPQPMPLAVGLDEILEGMHWLSQNAPPFLRYVREFPERPPSGVETFLYWSVAEYGYRPITSLNQAFVYRADAERNEPILLAQKQLYASHYFRARFEVSLLLDDSRGDRPATLLIYLDHSLFDDDLGWAQRKLLARGVKSELLDRLARRRDYLEGGR